MTRDYPHPILEPMGVAGFIVSIPMALIVWNFWFFVVGISVFLMTAGLAGILDVYVDEQRKRVP